LSRLASLGKALLFWVPLLAVFAAYVLQQPLLVTWGGTIGDAQQYLGMARQLADSGFPVQGAQPFVFRVATPALAAMLAPHDLLLGFSAVNLIFGLVTAVLLSCLLGLFIQHRPTRFVIILLLICAPLGPARLTSLFPVLGDSGAIALSLAILYLSLRSRYTLVTTTMVSLLAFAGAFFREITVVAPLSVWLAYLAVCLKNRTSLAHRELGLRFLPVLSSCVGFVMTLMLVESSTQLPFPEHFLGIIAWNLASPLRCCVALLVSYGPIILVPLALLRHLGRGGSQWSLRHLALLTYAFMMIMLAFVGGMHTDRHLFWAAIAVYPLVGITWRRYVDANRPGRIRALCVLAPVLGAQLLAHRMLWAIPHTIIRDHVPSVDNISHVLFAPYGEQLTTAATFASNMPEELYLPIILQYLVLLGYLIAAVTLGARRRQHGSADVS
jgi:hypothetical protein